MSIPPLESLPVSSRVTPRYLVFNSIRFATSSKDVDVGELRLSALTLFKEAEKIAISLERPTLRVTGHDHMAF